MRDCAPHQPVVKAVEASLSLLFDRKFPLLGRSLYVVTQERYEGHCYDQRTEQRSSHHDGKAAEELTGVAVQHKERKVSDDVCDRGEKDCRRQLCRTEPRRDDALEPICEATLDAVSGDYWNIDQ